MNLAETHEAVEKILADLTEAALRPGTHPFDKGFRDALAHARKLLTDTAYTDDEFFMIYLEGLAHRTRTWTDRLPKAADYTDGARKAGKAHGYATAGRIVEEALLAAGEVA